MAKKTVRPGPVERRPPVKERSRRGVGGFRGSAGCLVCLLAVVWPLSCSVNPATGKREFSLVGEAREIAMGKEAHPQILAQFGLYPDEEIQAYFRDLGKRLAAQSERPDLPWTFTVLDDPLVNAFALPGGFIYVTRGIMTHLNSEAELVGVLGHEIGHVTARHGASQMSKAMLAQLGLGIGMVAAPEAAASFGGLAQQLTGLLFLKYGRDDERQADGLGLRYSLRTGYDPEALIGVFDTLGRVSDAASGGQRLPGWASTHPAPDNRAELIRELLRQQLASAGASQQELRVARDDYLQRLDGMTFGSNPRNGFFEEQQFYHPDLAFQLEFPSGWTTQNTHSAVAAINKEQDAIIQLTLAQADSATEASRSFFSQDGLREGRSWAQAIGGFSTVTRGFEATDQDGTVQVGGFAAWIGDDDRVYQLVGYAKADRVEAVAATLRGSLSSFRRLRDRQKLSVEPMRIDLVRIGQAGRLDQLSDMTSSIDAKQLGLINRIEPDEIVPRGAVLKRVRGFNPAKRP